MIRYIVAFIITSLFLTICPVSAKDFSYENNLFKIMQYDQQKKYKKALDLGLKTKKENLTDAQKKELQEIMETLYFKKDKDDALKAFYVDYDKYENTYTYTSNLILYDDIVPIIIVSDKGTHYFLKFKAEHYNRTMINFNKVIINSDNKNITLTIEKSEDSLVSYQSYKRIAQGWAVLSGKEMFAVEKAMKGYDISFKMSGNDGAVVKQIYSPTKELIKKSVVVYVLLSGKMIKPGDTRF